MSDWIGYWAVEFTTYRQFTAVPSRLVGSLTIHPVYFPVCRIDRFALLGRSILLNIESKH